MALFEQDLVIYETLENGDKVIKMPITRVENVEGAASLSDLENIEVPVTSVNGKTGDVVVSDFNSDGHLVLPDGSEFWIA